MNDKSPALSGSLSLVMIFAVLCLTIFAALSLLTSKAELTLTNRWADSVAAYYRADSEATALAASLMSEDSGERRIDYAVPIDENRVLSVRLRIIGTDIEIQEWKPVHTGDWSPGTGYRLFEPEE
ncbi:MAG: hypothetical protein PHZ09_12735 [Eubacteriales bacterium]|jgi:hypothetical protein|nr:hypothetical protein [Eubacteriales bacterium]